MSELDEDQVAVTARDLAETLCFLERHHRSSEDSACDRCVLLGETMVTALRARYDYRDRALLDIRLGH